MKILCLAKYEGLLNEITGITYIKIFLLLFLTMMYN
jgi:hypothetical protein